MWRRQRALLRLRDELNVLALFDKVYDYNQHHDLADDRAHASREMRRTEIMSEINKLRASKLRYRSRTWLSSAALLLCVGGYVTLYYLLK